MVGGHFVCACDRNEDKKKVIHLLFIPQREAHTVLGSGLAVGVNIGGTKREPRKNA